MGIGEHPAGGSLGFCRSRLPPQSFLPVGIEEATPLLLAISSPSTVFPSCGYRGGDAVDALYRRRLQRLILATPSASYTSDAWCDQPVDFDLGIDFDFDSGRRLGPRHLS